MFTFFLSSILIIYCILLHGLQITNKLELETTSNSYRTRFTIIVPFRNEAANLPLLLDSISKLHYPKERFEVILVDDESEEVFSPHCSLFNIRIIKNNRVSNSLKDAISTAIPLSPANGSLPLMQIV
jgi:cellulose synthase/poly-beta-1,6-N-acetylglucosamine synthase-like glycosyltransferase